MWRNILGHWPEYFAYFNSFTVVLLVWMGHHRILKPVRAANTAAINVALLLLTLYLRKNAWLLLNQRTGTAGLSALPRWELVGTAAYALMAAVALVASSSLALAGTFAMWVFWAPVVVAAADENPPGRDVEVRQHRQPRREMLRRRRGQHEIPLRYHSRGKGRRSRITGGPHRYPMTTRVSGSRPRSPSSNTTAANSGRKVSRGISTNPRRA